MLPKINRIKKEKDFGTIFKNSKSLKSGLFIFKAGRNNLGLNRFGFVVGRKVSKKATTRNKIKRRLAEIIKTEMQNMKNGLDLVLIALPGVEKKEFCEIKEDIIKNLARLKLITR